MARRKALAIPDDLLDQLLTGGDAATALYSGEPRRLSRRRFCLSQATIASSFSCS